MPSGTLVPGSVTAGDMVMRLLPGGGIRIERGLYRSWSYPNAPPQLLKQAWKDCHENTHLCERGNTLAAGSQLAERDVS
ncbi:hypothetical protein GCM10008098_07480 [Rhodanobacter panaciterrae]|uniref:Uncharacterized protein n=1 Tax=Rhodanobacter panaciterrae TaxID=490572 RepID=A0ABQ2ZKY8_9GAMM|nr:hypothetical protein GCM10008098_07480 [Rhodanobacter panaciterrae]